MNPFKNITSKQLRQAANLKDKIQTLESKLGQILGSPANSATGAEPKRKRKMSAAGRARIVAAQKVRWAKVKGNKAPAKAVKKAKRKMSAAARAKISAAAKKRWAKAKAAGKKRL
jgi:hypothetical protein